MTDQALMTFITCIVTLLLVAAISAIALRRMHFSYTIGLVIVGLALGVLAQHVGVLEPFRRMRLTPNIILYLILPTLVFEASVNIDSRLLLKNLTPVLVLAAPGLLVSTLVVGGLVAVLTPLTIGPAMLFGALISATDPVAVIALFKEIGAPKRLTMLVDGESLFNDATAIVMFQIVMGIIVSGAWGMMVLLKGCSDFVFVFVGGTLVGAAIGYFMMRVIALAKNDPLIEIAFSTVVAYTAFIAANYYLNVSGVMAVVGAGIVVSWYGSTRFTPEVKQYLQQFWGYAAFVANSFIFLLLGFTEDFLVRSFDHIPGILMFLVYAIAAVTIARVAVVYGLVPLVNRLPRAQPISLGNQTVIFWGGLRGAVPIALCLSLAPDFPFRELIIELTLGVILFTLFVQGTTVSPLIRWFKLDKPDLVDRAARLSAIQSARRAGLERISRVEKTGYFSGHLIKRNRENYQQTVLKADKELADLRAETAIDATVIPQILWSQATALEQRVYRLFFEDGIVSEPVLRELEMTLEQHRDRIKSGEIPPHVPQTRSPAKQMMKWTVNVVARSLPWSRNAQRRRLRVLALSYEKEVALMYSSQRVTAELDRLAGLCGAQPSVAGECRQFYEQRRAMALKRLESMAKMFPEYMDAVQERTILRAVLDAELDVVKELAASGGISNMIELGLRQDIENALESLRQQQARELATNPECFLKDRHKKTQAP